MWYAIRTEEGKEEAVRQQIRALELTPFCDDWQILYCVKRKRYLGEWHDKKERFLPGYLFLVTDGMEFAATAGAGKRICREISGWNGMCSPVLNEEVQFLMKLTEGKDEIGMSYGVIHHDVLKISHGVLKGMESRIRKIDRHKRKGYISVRINGEEKIAEIGLEITEKT